MLISHAVFFCFFSLFFEKLYLKNYYFFLENEMNECTSGCIFLKCFSSTFSVHLIQKAKVVVLILLQVTDQYWPATNLEVLIVDCSVVSRD